MDSLAKTTAKLFGDGCDVQTKGPGRKQTRRDRNSRDKKESKTDTHRHTQRRRRERERTLGTLRTLLIGTLPNRFLLLSPD